MRQRLRRQFRRGRRRLRNFERRELREFRRWIEKTDNLVRLSVLVFVPLLIGVVTVLSNSVTQLSFFLFPPLASGTYTLFADPEGRYSSPWLFVAGMTVGALCGWLALAAATEIIYHVRPADFAVTGIAAALSVALTAVATGRSTSNSRPRSPPRSSCSSPEPPRSRTSPASS